MAHTSEAERRWRRMELWEALELRDQVADLAAARPDLAERLAPLTHELSRHIRRRAVELGLARKRRAA